MDAIHEQAVKWHGAEMKKALACLYDGRTFEAGVSDMSPAFAPQSFAARAAKELTLDTMHCFGPATTSILSTAAFGALEHHTTSIWNVGHTIRGS